MRLAEHIRNEQQYPGPVIFFVTALREHMQNAFDVHAYHYLVKPIDEQKFHTVRAGAIAESIKRNRREHLAVKRDGVVHMIALDEILFVESSRKQVAIHTKNGVIECYGKISEFAEKLSSDFYKCHRCYIVNMAHIARFSAKAIMLSGGQEVFLAREKYQGFVKAYAQYSMK
jgi:DNA-binding LytR/AlgR family response regulator